MMPDPKTYKQHFENKHPKNPMPEDLKGFWCGERVLRAPHASFTRRLQRQP